MYMVCDPGKIFADLVILHEHGVNKPGKGGVYGGEGKTETEAFCWAYFTCGNNAAMI